MFRKKRKAAGEEPAWEVISCSQDDIRQAVNAFARQADQRISLRSLIRQDNSLDPELLAPHLGGIPDRPFYMSKETFEVAEEQELVKMLDYAQIAVDQYFLETGNYPTMDGARSGKVSYFKLQHYLKEKPPMDLYLDPGDRMVTHRKPAEM
ncbi:DUF3939 domain-containing protein [Alkalicoccus urumqiensis]|uniref:DUF3939 domain-containing protein n=1 Tax=Alkalicoccus urumqiensis TaxID=1548213 RepID=A0A2P6MGS9_ALKUR|nr:DUF3939 domain-containing protein [Alkalicoccus urumqiensis]PRO65481.1 DUF3939 domain-containing protein [Alkalicoccus urumqiensis]